MICKRSKNDKVDIGFSFLLSWGKWWFTVLSAFISKNILDWLRYDS